METNKEQEILESIGRVELKLDAKIREDEERFQASEARFRRIEDEITDVRTAIMKHEVSFAEKITQCAGAAANAAEAAYKAQRSANDVRDEATKIVEGALRIHSASIAVTVDETVKRAVAPLSADVMLVQKNDETQNKELAEIKGLVQTVANAVVKTVSHKWLRRGVIALALIGALIGGGVAGYATATGSITAKEAVKP